MDKAYPSRINWENLPSRRTPINETNLNKGDSALRIIDDRVITLDTVKADKTTVAGHVKDITLNQTTGVLTITWENGATRTYDTALEKIAVNFDYDPDTQELILYDKDGHELARVDLSELITQDDFVDNNNFDWTVTTETIIDPTDPTKKHKIQHVNLKINDGSILERHLQPHYLADIKAEAMNAEISEQNAAQSADDADYYKTLSQSYAIGGTGQRAGEATDNSKYYSQLANTYRNNAQTSATNAATSATNAASHEDEALVYRNISEAYARGTIGGEEVPSTHPTYHNNSMYYAQLADESAQYANRSAVSVGQVVDTCRDYANQSLQHEIYAEQAATNANEYSISSRNYANQANTSANQASNYMTQSNNYSQLSKSYAVGDTGSRTGEDEDNSKYYSEVAAGHVTTASTILDDVRQAGDDAVAAIENALDTGAPDFYVDYSTGELMYTGTRFVFQIDYNTGDLMWGLAV